jgi:hypothetical protein
VGEEKEQIRLIWSISHVVQLLGQFDRFEQLWPCALRLSDATLAKLASLFIWEARNDDPYRKDRFDLERSSKGLDNVRARNHPVKEQEAAASFDTRDGQGNARG